MDLGERLVKLAKDTQTPEDDTLCFYDEVLVAVMLAYRQRVVAGRMEEKKNRRTR